ncbi:MAG: hypothetical protein M3203_06730, partial [Actinomycetota bacterium]|nr:hypothetical protein [Actinomycetota bacterium]
MTRPVDVLFVSGEPLWPSTHGGRIRAARIAGELSRHLAVRVLAPAEGVPAVDVPLHALPPPGPPVRVTAGPRLGGALLGP